VAPQNDIALPPGSTIGIFGGGQLGRMSVIAAARLGYRVHIYTDELDSPAGQLSHTCTVAPYTSENDLRKFAKEIDVATFEFENIPVESLRKIEDLVPVFPKPEILQVAQDRVAEKDFCKKLGIPTAPYWSVSNVASMERALTSLGGYALLKSTRFGYDGKNQIKIKVGDNLDQALERIGGGPGVLEGWVDYEKEISVIVVGSRRGEICCYDPVENEHSNYVLHKTMAPALISEQTKKSAVNIGESLARHLGVVGVLAVEMFVMSDGTVAVNEMAPRPHNSGHWTIDACGCSQFEQLIRSVCGLPLGSCDREADADMHNLLGEEVDEWLEYLEEPNLRLHLYGKSEVRPGRKMGHITRLKPLSTK
jgi:5-(carboxyamino)imidazole ribonucleotide synthase